jgi:hypothetical protein
VPIVKVKRWASFAVAGWTLAVAGGIGGLVARIVMPAPILPTTFGVGETNLVAISALGITWATVGAVLVFRRPDNPVGRIMVVVGLGLAMSVLTVAVAFAALAQGTDAGRQISSIAGAVTALLTPILVLVFYLPFIFPTGRGHTPRWHTIGRAVLWIAMIVATLLVVHPGDIHLLPGIPNPIGFGPDLRPVFGDAVVGAVDGLAILSLCPVVIAAVASRYRSGSSIERQQLKWFVVASALTVVAGVALFATATIAPGDIGEIPLIWFALAATTVPIAIGIAILRYRLYDIDRIISRTIGYALVSVIIAAVFVGGVLIGQRGLAGIVRDDSTIAVAASTLVAFTLFQPIRRRVQTTVDRRFNRARVDAEGMTEAFATRLRDQLDLATLTYELRRTAAASVEPVDAGIWLRSRPVARG